MKKIILGVVIITTLYCLPSCSNDKSKNDKTGDQRESPSAIAQTWCDLNSKLTKAGEENKETAKQALKDYEKWMEEKFKNDKDTYKEIEKEVEKCEDASEGK